MGIFFCVFPENYKAANVVNVREGGGCMQLKLVLFVIIGILFPALWAQI